MLRTGQTARAEPHIRLLRRLRPRKAEPFVLLARMFMLEGVLSEAHGALSAALRLQPSYPPAHAQLGVLLDQEGRHREAERAHRRAIALDPASPAYRNNLGYCLYLQARYTEAVQAYEAALARGASDRRVHNNLGFAQAKLGKLDLALRHFRLAGDSAKVANNMGLAYEDRGDFERAFSSFSDAALGDPTLAEARSNLRRVCERLGRPMPRLPEPEEGAP
jgi:Flp pilus assembly protein TadD